MKKLILGAAMILGLAISVPRTVANPVPPRCPNIHRAVGALETALHDLEVAGHDFCGHKVEAMESTRRALEHLRAAEACDRCR
ncbi:MAG TPA: hypothetical protein VEH49_02720 [Methylomirabilota bacterium]|jgi:hypothetical protein|nr:hypothetical protein [Methylomirabilota bacterium]